ncbi:MAG: ArsR family transcriptional regulator [Caldiserica bacterium]|nr:ArsR family transcriptional regulator [Caldisericota bacterium]MDH7563069.1 ArsR family transcriptional regulator [Caldisericota bacterium]
MIILEEEKSTKRQILLILKKKGKMTISDLARELEITPMGVRQHLSLLERDGLVATRIMRKPMGRPVYIYSLTEEADNLFPKKYEDLLESIMESVVLLDGPEKLDQILKTRAFKIADLYRGRFDSLDLSEKVEELERVLTEMGYLVEVKRINNHSFALDNYNCTLNSIARKYPQICRWELEIFRSLLGVRIDRISDLASGGLNCSFLIQGIDKD